MSNKVNLLKSTSIAHKKNLPFCFGFTLAETLITLVIIGVVAAITIPSLTASYDEQARTTRIKKNYSIFSQAMTFVKAAGGDMDMGIEDGNDDVMNDWFNDYLKPRLGTIKICYDDTGCWNNGHTYGYNGSVTHYSRSGKGIGDNTINAILTDGTMVNIDGFGYNDMRDKLGIETNGSAGLVIFFDINGARKPNTLGKDVFVVTYVPGQGMILPYRDKTTSDCNKNGYGYSCINRYLKSN